ncbi:MAG: ABC transporter substrate-binding protein [Planctomycetia bacterium]|nr:ABC transporter substrate-binding protein [Planctomycetia bacterium]
MSRRLLLVVADIFLLICAMSVCSLLAGEEDAANEPTTMQIHNETAVQEVPVPDELTSIHVMLGTEPAVQDVGFLVAQKEGFYEDAGLPPVVIDWNTLCVHPARILYPGKCQFCVGDLPQICRDVSTGSRFVVFLTLIHETTQGLLFRKDWNPEIKSLSDFNGKRIAYYASRSISAKTALKIAGNQCELFPVTHKNAAIIQPNAMHGLCIRSYHLPGPMHFSRHRSETAFIPFADFCNMPEDALMCTRAFAERHGTICERFADATLLGWQHALSNETDAIDTLERCFTENYIVFDRRILVEEFRRLRAYLTRSPLTRDSLRVSREEYSHMLNLLIGTGMIESDKAPDPNVLFYDRCIEPEPLATSESETALHETETRDSEQTGETGNDAPDREDEP